MPPNTIPSYCRLFLATPQCFDLPDLQKKLAAAISGGDIASLLITNKDAAKRRQAAMALTKMAQDAGIAVLIDRDVETVLACKADGVQLDEAGPDFQEALERLGSEKIVGVYCGSERHSAMAAGEAGADYVAFDNFTLDGEKEPIADWWARVFEVPCVVLEPLEMEQARAAATNKVDFICPPDNMWESEQTAKETVRGYNAMIAEVQIETN